MNTTKEESIQMYLSAFGPAEGQKLVDFRDELLEKCRIGKISKEAVFTDWKVALLAAEKRVLEARKETKQ